jgi:phosphopantothenoylcysteine decarboxylase/phosphopantothenate--cysteine ligase
MTEPADILEHVRCLLSRGGPLAGRKIVVTAGGTQEPLDPVRVLTNRSSGKQGFALAQAALDMGAEVTLVAAPVSLPAPIGAQRVDVFTAEDMLQAVLAAVPQADALVMAAAVADFRPVAPPSEKIKKEHGLPQIRLEHTPDILREVAQVRASTGWPHLTVGFAAESQDLLENARRKLEAKKLDLLVANDITAQDAGFAVDTNRVTLVYGGGCSQALPLMGKDEVAWQVMEKVVELLR